MAENPAADRAAYRLAMYRDHAADRAADPLRLAMVTRVARCRDRPADPLALIRCEMSRPCRLGTWTPRRCELTLRVNIKLT